MSERSNVDHTRWQGFSTNATHAAADPDPQARAVEDSIYASAAFAQDVMGRLLTAAASTWWAIAYPVDPLGDLAAVRELRV